MFPKQTKLYNRQGITVKNIIKETYKRRRRDRKDN